MKLKLFASILFVIILIFLFSFGKNNNLVCHICKQPNLISYYNLNNFDKNLFLVGLGTFTSIYIFIANLIPNKILQLFKEIKVSFEIDNPRFYNSTDKNKVYLQYFLKLKNNSNFVLNPFEIYYKEVYVNDKFIDYLSSKRLSDVTNKNLLLHNLKYHLISVYFDFDFTTPSFETEEPYLKFYFDTNNSLLISNNETIGDIIKIQFTMLNNELLKDHNLELKLNLKEFVDYFNFLKQLFFESVDLLTQFNFNLNLTDNIKFNLEKFTNNLIKNNNKKLLLFNMSNIILEYNLESQLEIILNEYINNKNFIKENINILKSNESKYHLNNDFSSLCFKTKYIIIDCVKLDLIDKYKPKIELLKKV